MDVVCADEERLQSVVFESLGTKFDILVADISEHGRLRVYAIVFTCFGNDRTLYVAEKSKERMS